MTEVRALSEADEAAVRKRVDATKGKALKMAAEAATAESIKAAFNDRAALLATLDSSRAALGVLVEAAKECADELTSYVEAHYANTKEYPSELRRYNRDIEPALKVEAIIRNLPAAAETHLERVRATERDHANAGRMEWFNKCTAAEAKLSARVELTEDARNAVIEECARIAAAHKPPAAKYPRSNEASSEQLWQTIQDEQRGETIAAEIIAKAIRARLTASVRATGTEGCK